MDENYKEVDFYGYCATCEHKELKEEDEPCAECLANPVRYASVKPIKWTERTVTKKKPEKGEEVLL